jgi:manganese-dependent inorganic pyrophosphatase
LVDASDLPGLEGKVNPNSVIEIIDHRKINNAEKFPNAKIQIELVGAAATLVAEKFFKNNIEVSVNAARVLCGAIISNTLNFRGPIVTERDRQIFENLNRVAKIPENFAYEMFLSKSDLSGEKLVREFGRELATVEFVGKKIGIVQLEIVGAEELLKTRRPELEKLLRSAKNEQNFDFIFLTIVDLKEYQNHLLAIDYESEVLVKQALDVVFENSVAIRKELLMRKSIIPKLKEVLER